MICSRSLFLCAALLAILPSTKSEAAPIDIQDRRELFADRHIIEKISGDLEVRLHHPAPQEIALEHNEPWEGSGSGYHTVFHDGEKYRMYYKAWQLDLVDEGIAPSENRFLCYAESEDGIVWTKPALGLFEHGGNKENNIVISPTGDFGKLHPDGAHAAVFLDENPDCPPEAKFKMLARSLEPKGLLVLKSKDGIHWTPLVDKPVLTEGAFDSQNLAFWDPVRKEYRAYWRIFSNNRRAIRTASSRDLITWNPHSNVSYAGGAPAEHLYTNQIKPYHRAPHLFVGFPARYTERDADSPSLEALPEWSHRQLRMSATERLGTGITDSLFICGRDGLVFERWSEAFLRPGPERPGQWKYGDNYLAWHLVETKSKLPGAPPELSFYATEGYWTGKSNQLRRYTLRLDGFVSASAKLSGGSVLTKPLRFSGDSLSVNFSTSATGSLRVGIEYADGVPVKNFGLEDCPGIFGDSVDRSVTWAGSPNLAALAGKSIRLRFELKDADLYSFRFQKTSGKK